MARDGRIGMGFADRLVIVLAWMTTCGLVYVLGFYVGKGTHERSLVLEDRVVRLPVTSQPPPEGQRPRSENEFVFYDKLMGEQSGERPEPVKPVAAPATPPHESTPPRPSTPAEQTPAAAAARPVAPPPAKTPPPRTPDRSAPAPAPPAPAVLARGPVPAPAATPPPTAVQPGAGGWTVLANPTQNRQEADNLVRQLRTRGYDATLVRVLRDRDTWYRVQVGRFASAEQAMDVMHRLREREGVTHAFVASE
jgi:cell division protein FtsN